MTCTVVIHTKACLKIIYILNTSIFERTPISCSGGQDRCSFHTTGSRAVLRAIAIARFSLNKYIHLYFFVSLYAKNIPINLWICWCSFIFSVNNLTTYFSVPTLEDCLENQGKITSVNVSVIRMYTVCRVVQSKC